MQEIDELITAMAPSEANVLITGESGVGKEVIANVIHSRSLRAEKPMVKLNCAAFPQADDRIRTVRLRERRIHRRDERFPGMIAEANGSTLFLDEISEMPAELQTRFLRVLQEGEYRSLGSTRTMTSNFRVVAATNRPIQQALAENRLRSDLYYRLNTFQIEVPPLRERKARYPATGRHVREAIRAAAGKSRAGDHAGSFSEAARLLVAGKRARIAKCDRVCRRSRAAKFDHGERVADGSAIAGRAAKTERTAERQSAKPQSLDEMERNAILQALAQRHGNKKRPRSCSVFSVRRFITR